MRSLKVPRQMDKISSMRYGGKILASTHEYVASVICEGMTAFNLDQLIYQFIVDHQATPAFLGFNGYKYSSCISKNDEIVHGIPHKDKCFYPGDIVSIDIGVAYMGFCVDAARTYAIGTVSNEAQHLMDVTQQSFFTGIDGVCEGAHLGDISFGIQSYVESQNLTIVEDLYSHGIGKSLHEDPLIPNYGKKGVGMMLKEGMTFAIEPMVNIGSKDIMTLNDGWTIVTADRQLSAHYENTILITKCSVEVLTLDSL